MCGIGLIVSGLRILSERDSSTQEEQVLDGLDLTAEDLSGALKNRGPDTMGRHTILVGSNGFVSTCLPKNSDRQGKKLEVALEFVAATLQLRGATQVLQPLKDHYNNVLVFNGEIFDGIAVKIHENDGQVLLDSLNQCCHCQCHTKGRTHSCGCIKSEQGHISVPCLLSAIRGPWALIYWQDEFKTLWFGHDVLGRRSLLVHWPSQRDPRLVFSSVSPRSVGSQRVNIFDYWEDLPCGLYSISMEFSDNQYRGRLQKHDWEDVTLFNLAVWERSCIEPSNAQLDNDIHLVQGTHSECAGQVIPRSRVGLSYHLQVLSALQQSVKRRTSNIFRPEQVICDLQGADETSVEAPFAILFSGGLDSMVLAAIADRCVPSNWSIDLLNVSFEGQTAPDRISAIAGKTELCSISHSCRWRLVEIDGDPASLGQLHEDLLSLICPSKTHMDLNIGTALWLAARGSGWVTENAVRKEYRSKARVILVGSGADEQCAGYGRHRTKFREGGWKALEREMRLDMQRLWKRNMGRDDRCMADNGKEARFPFLDEDVIQCLLDIPLWEIADLREPLGQGDKKILRKIALELGLKKAASLPKRAIQFGSRIAQESNRRNFGSNRAANQVSAGSVTLPMF